MKPNVARFYMNLSGIVPRIWRRVDVPIDMNLEDFHDVIQAAMGWYDCHLWKFNIDGQDFGASDAELRVPESLSARNITLKTLFSRGSYEMLYTYDMGDWWQHFVFVESLVRGDPKVSYPRLVDGQRRTPPEDSGGAFRYMEFLEASADPKHPDHGRLTDWPGDVKIGSVDTETFDEARTRRRIEKIAMSRAAKKKAKKLEKSDRSPSAGRRPRADTAATEKAGNG